jgi:hypothetical protein
VGEASPSPPEAPSCSGVWGLDPSAWAGPAAMGREAGGPSALCRNCQDLAPLGGPVRLNFNPSSFPAGSPKRWRKASDSKCRASGEKAASRRAEPPGCSKLGLGSLAIRGRSEAPASRCCLRGRRQVCRWRGQSLARLGGLEQVGGRWA